MHKKYPPICLGSPGEDISTRDLHNIVQRFKRFNQSRLQSVQNFLNPRQQRFLPLLPLIFHQNHAFLPGYVSGETPAGITDYTPDRETLLTARQFSKNFRYTRRLLPEYPIEGIFLMGSVGSIAFSKSSDLDIWLCHASSLSENGITELQQKASDVERWALTLGLEVHFFLIDSARFRKGHHAPLSSESSGQTQHYLLLEEFYRTAIYVAGKSPAWWIVPPHQENHYTVYLTHLLSNRFVSPREIIDFGGLESVPADEFISATLWHLYKSLNAPFKSLLKLFLMECYASEYPRPQWISLALKKAIYAGDLSLDKLDAYLAVYEKVETYLHLVASQKRLSLSRQCFFLKIMGSTPRALDQQTRLQRGLFMQKIAQQWHWPDGMLEDLNKQHYWLIQKATDQHHIIRDQLKQCLRMILRFAGQHAAEDYRSNHDLQLIGRKLHAFLEYKPGKIEIITTRSNVNKKEEYLSLIEIAHEHAEPLWHLYCGYTERQHHADATALHHDDSFIGVLCWIVVNGVYHHRLNIHLDTIRLSVSREEAVSLLNHLQVFFSNHLTLKKDNLDVYALPNQLLASFLVINLGETLPDERQDGQLVISERSDPLSYGESRRCFVQRLDQISISSWGEVTNSRHFGLEGLLTCFTELFSNSQPSLPGYHCQVLCLTPLRGRSIELRINAILEVLRELYGPCSNTNWRYILPARAGYLVFNKIQDQLQYRKLETVEQLLHELSSTQHLYAPVYFDEFVLQRSEIPLLYRHISEHTLQVFYHTADNLTTVHVIDEKGALFTRQHTNCDEPQPILADYDGFLQTLINQGKIPLNCTIRFFELKRNTAGTLSCLAVAFKPPESFMDLTIRIIAGSSDINEENLTIICNDRVFTSTSTDIVFAEVRDYIREFRKEKNQYPFHINEVDVPPVLLGVTSLNQAHAVHYLQYKQSIELRLSLDKDVTGS